MFKLVYFALVVLQIGSLYSKKIELDLLMPNVSPQQKDTYLCSKYEVGQDPVYITEFEANSSKEIAHHILLYACDEVGTDQVWNCGEMHAGQKNDQYKSGPVCHGGKQSIIFAWALDAPKLVLPKDVAFKIGGDTDKKYLVMQVHYANVEKFVNGGSDNSGLKLTGQTEPVGHTAGVYLLATGGYIQPNKKEYFEAACEIKEDLVMHPFAYRTHAHKLGIVNSGYVVKHNSDGTQDWTEIGRRSPQLPQMFYPASNKVEINKGDILVGRCTMKNFLDRTVYIGSTGDDEMCNFYIMYFVKGDKVLNNNICMSYGPPYWHLNNFKDIKGRHLDLEKMPENSEQVPEDQEILMSDMEGHNGMHNMQSNAHEAHDAEEKETDSTEFKNLLESNKLSSNLKAQLLNSLMADADDENASESDEESKENADEFENYLNELEKEYYLRKLLKKINLN